jgi:hypothetical protein
LKKRLTWLVVLVLAGGTLSVASERKHPDFSGTWVLDKNSTPNVPSALDSYTMAAKQSSQQITVKTQVEGDFRPNRRNTQASRDPDEDSSGQVGGTYPGGGGGGYPGGGYPSGGIGYPRGRMGGIGVGGIGGMGRRGGSRPGGTGRSRGDNQSAGRALGVTVPDGSFALNGQECTVDLQGRTSGKATVKAKWVKSGKDLELAVNRHLDMEGSTEELKSKEQWTLSDDGQTLVVDRSVKGAHGSQSAKLTFRRANEEQKAQ